MWLRRCRSTAPAIKDDPEALALYREAMKEQGNNQYTKSNGNNVTEAQTGNSRAYSIARVQQSFKRKRLAPVCRSGV